MISRSTINLLEKEIKNFIDVVKNLDNIHISTPDIPRRDVQYIRSEVKELTEQYQEVLREIKKKVEYLTGELEAVRNMEWNTINIALFGETNAGKSTLIEAIIGGNGRTIGDGRKDFTKSINVYGFSEEIKFLDMPGIEGDERKVKEEIWKAVKKAHLVFYVYPDTKEPERGTLEKIKNYLRKNAEIYTILNIRGICPPPVLQKKFENSQAIKERTDEHLRKTLGDIYKGSFQVHALFGFFSRARNIPSNLQEKYNTSIRFYGSKEELKKASNIEDIISFIESFTRNNEDYQLKVLWGNFRKILSTQEEILARILKFKKEYDRNIKEIKEELKQIQNKFGREKKVLETNIKRIIQEKTDELRIGLRNTIHSNIDNERNVRNIERSIKQRIGEFKQQFKQELEQEIKDFKDRILKDLNSLRKKIEFMASFKVETDLRSVLDKLNYSFGEIFKEIADALFSIGSTIITFLINPILGIIVGIINLLRKLWDWFFGNPGEKKARAKREANERIEETIRKIRNEINKKLKETYKEIEKQFREIIRQVENINRNLKRISRTLDPVISKLIETNIYTAVVFVKQLDHSAKFAYIQTTLKEGTHIAVVTSNPSDLKLRFKQIGIENVYTYSSIEELKRSLNYSKGEFYKRLKRIFC